MNIYLPDPRVAKIKRQRELAEQAEIDAQVQEQIALENAERARAVAAERERVALGREKIKPKLRLASIKLARSAQRTIDDSAELEAVYDEARLADLGLSAYVLTGAIEHLKYALEQFRVETARAGLADDDSIARQKRNDQVAKLREPAANPHGMRTVKGYVTDEAFLGPLAALLKQRRQSVPSMPEPRR